MTPHDDEFYIGYEPALPPGIAGRLRRVAGAIGGTVLAGVLAVLLSHPRLADARFDFGHPVDSAGVLERDPYPSLTVEGRRIWLVGQGKRGADDVLAGVSDGGVRLRGTPIERGLHTMLEVVPGTAAPTTVAAGVHRGAPPRALESARQAPGGEVVMRRGEIVDSKCFLGVMNPGEGTVHRDCASLCLRGGVPPMLLVRDAAGGEALILLVSRDGHALNDALAPLAGLPVEVRGRLTHDARGAVLWADAGDYRRLGRHEP